MERASEALFALKQSRSVTRGGSIRKAFHSLSWWPKDVEKVNPDLIVRDKQGRSYAERELSEDRGYKAGRTNESGR
jgi:hypothetical protein